MGKATTGVEKPTTYPLSGEQALQVLRILSQRSVAIAKEIAEVSALVFCDVSVEDVASSVFDVLDELAVEDCWSKAGRQRGGYRDQYDVADEMICEAFSPFIQQIDAFHRTGEHVSELIYIQGVLLGLYQYKTDATSDFYEHYGEDYPESFEDDVFKAWKKRHPDDSSGLQMLHSFLDDHCPDWSEEPEPTL
ncbi:MAG: hypothetical protein RBR15_15195 [Sphaerochaeta sp.]|nr:hypothetical protein [Sphaerochaeta sp.]